MYIPIFLSLFIETIEKNHWGQGCGGIEFQSHFTHTRTHVHTDTHTQKACSNYRTPPPSLHSHSLLGVAGCEGNKCSTGSWTQASVTNSLWPKANLGPTDPLAPAQHWVVTRTLPSCQSVLTKSQPGQKQAGRTAGRIFLLVLLQINKKKHMQLTYC